MSNSLGSIKKKKKKDKHISEKLVSIITSEPWDFGEYKAVTSTEVKLFEDMIRDGKTGGMNFLEFLSYFKRFAKESPKSVLSGGNEKRFWTAIVAAGNARRANDIRYRKMGGIGAGLESDNRAYQFAYLIRSWQRAKQSYRFSKPFYDMLAPTPNKEFYPQVFSSLPHRSFFLDMRGLGEEVEVFTDGTTQELTGVFVAVAPVVQEDGKGCMLTMGFCGEIGPSFVVHAGYAYDIKSSVVRDVGDSESSDLFGRIINLILYIASQNADIVPSQRPEKHLPLDAAKKKTSGGQSKSKAVSQMDVGYRVGAAIEKRNAVCQLFDHSGEGKGSRKSPHVRSAHWHHYWTGKRDEPEKREVKVRWVEETLVNCNEFDDVIVTEHRNRTTALEANG